MAAISPGRLEFGATDLRYNGAAVSGSAVYAARDLISLEAKKDIYFGGVSTFSGQIVVSGVGTYSRVVVFDTHTALVVAGGWTDVNGNFSFTGLSGSSNYYAIGFDPVTLLQTAIYPAITSSGGGRCFTF